VKAFDIGWIPQGWQRGDKLRIVNAHYRCGPNIGLESVEPRFVLPTFDQNIEVIRFHYAERIKVLDWLRWFCFACDYNQLLDQIN
jgi:hypothetical protein